MAAPGPARRAGPEAADHGRDPARRHRSATPRIEKSSGNAFYDQAALRAIMDARAHSRTCPRTGRSPSLRVMFRFDLEPDDADERSAPSSPLLVALAAGRGAARRLLAAAARPPARRRADVLLNVLATGAKKLNIVHARLHGGGRPRPQRARAARSPRSTARDLTFSALFSVVAGAPALPAGDRRGAAQGVGRLRRGGRARRAAGRAHAARRPRSRCEMRLYDLTSPEFRLIATKTFAAAAAPSRGGSPTRSPTRWCSSSPARRASPTPRSPT